MHAPVRRRPSTPAAINRALLLALEASYVMACAECLVHHLVGPDFVPRLAWLCALAATLVRRG